MHPSTELTLEAMQYLQETKDFTHVLDLGCGNAILSLVAASIWDCRVVAADISEKAVADAVAHVATQNLQARIRILRSDGLANPEIARAAPYDLILCDMLAHQQFAMSRELAALLAPNGAIVLSGILAWLEADIVAAFTVLGYTVTQRLEMQQWRTLVLGKHSEIMLDFTE